MKCFVLAGGRGERLWPLSRKNYPKQFIQIQKNHSIFQETVARNMPYCDEFIIVTSYEYRYIIESQMSAFQGITYRCVYEKTPLKTAAAVTLVCQDLSHSELIFVVASNHLLDNNDDELNNYRDSVLRAKVLAKEGRIVTFGIRKKDIKPYMGFIRCDGENVLEFIEKPNAVQFNEITEDDCFLRNSGMYLFEVGTFQNELRKQDKCFYELCNDIYKQRSIEKSFIVYESQEMHKEVLKSIEKILIERTSVLSVVNSSFDWKDISRLEDIEMTEYQQKGIGVADCCQNTTIINNSSKQAVVVNGIDNALVVNTTDAVYIGRYGSSGDVKKTLSQFPELQAFGDKGTVFYRTWGFYEELIEEPTFRVRKVTVYPGKGIYSHQHKLRSENWTVVEGEAVAIIDGITMECILRSNIDIPIGSEHQIVNTGYTNTVLIETAIGEIIHDNDNIAIGDAEVGIVGEPLIKLRPAFKDYLWGGTKLRDVYKKNCDYDIIAESWELSAHPAGQSIVDSGQFRGMSFGAYLDMVGKDALGWKIQPGNDFPLLVKFIDAKGDLSVQVHPDDEYALEHEHEYGKNEMWYIVDCEPNSYLYVGFNRNVTREEVEERVRNNTILDVLNKVSTLKGDIFFIPAGTVHAIGAGNLICEIQQSSNCTYRLYDYDRQDKYGNSRELHLDKALDVLNFNKYQPQKYDIQENSEGIVLSRCKYFESVIYDVEDELNLNIDNSHFASVICLLGEGFIESGNVKEKIIKGDSFFVRAGEKIKLLGSLKVIVSCV
jgi:mannose-1-phosphate guanylyltransferase/mannose-6-phosphate isomerase